jgi:hypothetical protein
MAWFYFKLPALYVNYFFFFQLIKKQSFKTFFQTQTRQVQLMALQIFPEATLKIKHLAERMHYYYLNKSPTDKFEGIKAFFVDEQRPGVTPDLVEWLLSQTVAVVGIAEKKTFSKEDAEDNCVLIYAAMLIVSWPCQINGQTFSYAPLIFINSSLDQQEFFQLLINYAAQKIKGLFIFPGDTLLRAPRVSHTDFSQRILKYDSKFSVQRASFAIMDMQDPEFKEHVKSFFIANGTKDGLHWQNLGPETLDALLNFPSCVKVAFMQTCGKISHMAIIQIDREDVVRLLWFAGVGHSNNLKFLKAISATYKESLLLDIGSHELLQSEAILEETEEDDNAEYALYQSKEVVVSSMESVALPGVI